MGFPTGERYTGTPHQNQKLESQFLRKAEFMYTNKVPIWNGEFGPVYSSDGPGSKEINDERFNLLGQQLRIYDKYKVSWSIWLYKDIGVQGAPPRGTDWLFFLGLGTKLVCRNGLHVPGKPMDQDLETVFGKEEGPTS